MKDKDLLIVVERFKNGLNSKATGGNMEDKDYKQDREILLVSRIKKLLPQFVSTCRTIDEYWRYIKTIPQNGGVWETRRVFLTNEFAPIFIELENSIRNANAPLSTPQLKIVDNEYIKGLVNRAYDDITQNNFDSALTKSRTMLEEVFCHAVEKAKETPSDKGDIGKLYNQVKTIYKMHQSVDMDKRVNGLLSGLEKMLTAIAEMRNSNSDSHGVGSKRIEIKAHHARLFVNSAQVFSEFILAVCGAIVGNAAK